MSGENLVSEKCPIFPKNCVFSITHLVPLCQLFLWHILQTICDKTIIKNPTEQLSPMVVIVLRESLR